MAKSAGKEKDPLMLTAVVLLVIGALNWGLVGLLDINLVNWLLGSWPMVERVVYIVVGVAGLYKVYYLLMKKW